jgi:localization factor PodJL
MKAGKSWSLRDVDEQTRAALLKAAEKSGLSVTDWLGTRPEGDGAAAAISTPPARATMAAPLQSAAPTPSGSPGDDQSLEVREAIGRLTARLGLMDESARATVTGLPARLAEIENRLAFLVDAKQSPEERTRSLGDASMMIDALVRDIDGAALRSSTLGGKPPAKPPEAATPAPRLVAPITKGAEASVPPQRPMSAAAEQLSDIRFQLDALLADDADRQHEPPPRAASSETVLRVPDPRADEAAPHTAPMRSAQSSADSSGAADHLRRLETQLGEIMSRLPAKKDADLAAAIREISSRQRAIDERAETAAMRRDQKALGDAVAALHGEVANLAGRVATIRRDNSADAGVVTDLTKRIDALAADRPVDRTLLQGIRADLDQLKAGMVDSAQRNAVGDLEERYVAIARRVDEFIAKAPDAARIDALGEQIAALRHALESGGRSDSARLEARLAEIAAAVSEAANAAPPVMAVDVSKLEQRFDSLAKTVAMALSRAPLNPGAHDEVREVGTRLDEISANVGRLLEKTQLQSPAHAESPTVAALEGRLSQMAANINGLLDREATGDPAPVIEKLEARLQTIAESVDGLFMGMPPSETNAILKHIDQRFDRMSIGGQGAPGLGRLEARLDRIASDLEQFGAPKPGTVDEDGLNQRLDQIAEALTGLARRSTSTVEVETLHARLQNIADRIERVNVPENTIQADLDDIRTEVSSIRAVHQRLQTLTERIDSIAAVQHQPLLAIAEIKDGIGAIRSLYDRMQSLTDRIDRMSASQRDPVPAEQMKAGFAAMRSVQEQFQALREKLEGSPASANAPTRTLDEMRAGVAAITAVHGEMRSLSERIQGMAVQRAPVAVLEDIKKDIVEIRSELSNRRSASTEPLERLVADLAKQVANVSHAPSDPKGIADLANRVTALAGELEEAKPRVQRLEEIEARMARLQENLADTRNDSIEAAKAEARGVVQDLSRMVSSGEVDASVIAALVQDLEGLKNNTGDSDRRTRSKLDGMSTTLAQVVSRLSQLEGEATRRAAATETVTPHFTNDWPAAPDTAPPLPGVVEAVTVEKDPREQRADFIAAARRAAQSAAAESAKPNRTDADDKADKPGALARFSQAILNRKRTLLLAAAAVVLAVGALQIFADRLNGPSGQARLAAVPLPAPVKLALAAPAPAIPLPAPTSTKSEIATPATPALPPPGATATLASNASSFTAPAGVDRTLAFAEPVYKSQAAPPPIDLTATSAIPPAAGPAGAPVPPTSAHVASPPIVRVAATTADTNGATNPLVDRAIGSLKLTTAALDGNPVAAFEVGARYASGDRVPRNMTKAGEWYQRAAEGGLAVAQFRLASLYERGEGVRKDLGQALTWYQRAADQGNINAMHNLAVLLSQGVNAPADQKLALKWFIAAANYGLRDSQYNLGVIYARGLGTVPSMPEAYKWFAIAARDGDPDAAARRDEIATSLSASEIAQASNAASSWRSKAAYVDANSVTPPAGGWDSDVITENDRQVLVKTIQTLLADQGYDPGPADGRLGPKTVRAVKDFQRTAGVAQTGQIDTTLLAALSVEDR